MEKDMKKLLGRALEEHEKSGKCSARHNEIILEDCHSKGKSCPIKPFLMNTAYMQDGNHKNRQIYDDNFEEIDSNSMKRTMKEFVELAELATMLQDPEYLVPHLSKSSENRKLSRDALKYFGNRHGPEEGSKHALKHVFGPLIQLFGNRLDKEPLEIKDVIPEKMNKNTPHHKDKYKDILTFSFRVPMEKGWNDGNWQKKLPEVINHLMQEAI